MATTSAALTPDLVKSIPLFDGMGEAALSSLSQVFETQHYERGQVVFEAGDAPKFLRILVDGALSIRGQAERLLELRPVSVVGELSALTGDPRNLAAVALGDTKLLAAPAERLESFLREQGDIGFELQRNLLRLAARKIGRDQRRLGEMRQNIVDTQHAMKRMRDAILDGEDNPLHVALFEELDCLIEQNRKIHYLVEPSRLVPTHVRLGDGKRHPVTAISAEWLYFSVQDSELRADQELSFSLLLDGDEIPLSGCIERVTETEVAVYLDDMIPDYEAKLNAHLARAQLLDIVL
jgi:CRP/FNR family transcriptional regulator, cyclic AMP receptor protein